VTSHGAAHETDGDFLDPILRGLLSAQTTWLASRDLVALRRRLIALLAALE
jgi:hypothetical protein